MWDRCLSALAASAMVCRAVLAMPRGTISLSERLGMFPCRRLPLDSEVAVHWNENHIPFIEASSDQDAAFALGMVHTHLRWSQMALARMTAYGRLSEFAGPAFADVDRGLRSLSCARSTGDTWRSSGEAARVWVKRFVDGINCYQELAPVEPHEFRVLGLKRERWTVGDILAIGRLAHNDMSWPAWRGLAQLSSRSDWPDLCRRTLEGGGSLGPRFPGGPYCSVLDNLLVNRCRPGGTSFVLGPAHTATGGTIVANDSCSGILVPNAWLIAGLRSPSYHAVGLMVPGQPIFPMGRSPYIGWGGIRVHAPVDPLSDHRDMPHAFDPRNRPRVGPRLGADCDTVIPDTLRGPLAMDVQLSFGPTMPATALARTDCPASKRIEALLGVSRAQGFFGVSFSTSRLRSSRHGHGLRGPSGPYRQGPVGPHTESGKPYRDPGNRRSRGGGGRERLSHGARASILLGSDARPLGRGQWSIRKRQAG